jgi:hypothetical protein
MKMGKECRICNLLESQHENQEHNFDFSGWFMDDFGILRHDIFNFVEKPKNDFEDDKLRSSVS